MRSLATFQAAELKQILFLRAEALSSALAGLQPEKTVGPVGPVGPVDSVDSVGPYSGWSRA